jgi:DNA polymerase-4
MAIMRKIIHIDMDAFYASVEQRDNPEYRGKPLIVGGPPEGRGGVVATASYEARKFGIHSAMPSKKALQQCPEAIFIRPRFEAYKAVSKKIREIFHRYTDLVEPLSLDEAFLDVTADRQGIGSALDIAAFIKKSIKEELELTASAGVSINKFLAKIASDMKKPDGLTFIGPSAIASFMEKLPVEKFFGVGKVTAAKMKEMGLHTGRDVKALPEAELMKSFGKNGRFFYQIVRGIDDRPVEPNRETKSLSAEDTFPVDLTSFAEMKQELNRIAQTVSDRLQHYGLKGRTVSIKVRYSDFKLITRSRSFPQPVQDAEKIAAVACQLLEGTEPEGKPVRLLGINISGFGETVSVPKSAPAKEQLLLFPFTN